MNKLSVLCAEVVTWSLSANHYLITCSAVLWAAECPCLSIFKQHLCRLAGQYRDINESHFIMLTLLIVNAKRFNLAAYCTHHRPCIGHYKTCSVMLLSSKLFNVSTNRGIG